MKMSEPPVFTPQFQTQLRDGIREQPLDQGELRHVAWAGALYIGKVSITVPVEYAEMATLTIDGERYRLFRQIS